MAITKKRRIFIEEYLNCWNATEAARRAGYAHPHVMGSRLRKVKEIADQIDRYVQDRAMSAEEALDLLGQFARGSLEDVATFQNGTWKIDIQKAQAAGKLNLVRKIKATKYGYEIELEDRQAAIDKLLKVMGLYRETHVQEGEIVLKVVRDGIDDPSAPTARRAVADQTINSKA